MNPKHAMHWLLHGRGSTRPIAVFRILLVFLVWARLSEELTLWSAQSAAEAAVGFGLLLFGSMVLVGFRTRQAMTCLAVLLGVVYFYFGLFVDRYPYQHHHIYLLFICSALTACGPCDKSFSLDSSLARKEGREVDETGSLTASRLLVIQLASVYFWGAIDKSNVTFLSGLRLEQILYLHYYETVWADFLLHRPLIVFASNTVIVIEYVLPLLLLTGRCPRLTIAIAVVLHGAFYFLLPVQTFSATMLAMYIFAIPARWIDRFFGQLPANNSAVRVE